MIRTITKLEDLTALRHCWEHWKIDDLDIDFDHFSLVCRLRHKEQTPYVMVLEEDGKPEAILVGRLENTQFAPAVGYFKPLKFRSTILRVVSSSWIGPQEERIGEVFARYLWQTLASKVADRVVFDKTQNGSKLFGAVSSYCPAWFCEKSPRWGIHWEMDIPNEEGFIQRKVRSKHRAWMKKKERDLEAAFPDRLRWQWLREFEDMSRFCAQVEEVASQTYQRSLGAGFRNDEEHRQRFGLFANRGQLRAQLLEIDGKIRAFWIGVILGDTFHSAETGYTPDLGEYEVGTQVFARMVDSLVRDGAIRKFDFGLGDAGYKKRFGDRNWQESTVLMFAPTIKGVTFRICWSCFVAIDDIGRRLLSRFNAVDLVKTRWRRWLASGRPSANAK